MMVRMTATGTTQAAAGRTRSPIARVGRVVTQVFLFLILMNLLIGAVGERNLSIWATLAVGVLICAPLIYWPMLGLLVVGLYGALNIFW